MRETSNLYLLVLSNGGWEGLGKIREKEMEKAAKKLKFKDFKVIDDNKIADGPHEWDVGVVKGHVQTHLKEMASKGIEFSSIVTFDEYGVSHHPNHIACHFACKELFAENKLNSADLYTLTTVHWFRKYNAFLDIFTSSSANINYYLSSSHHAVTTLAIHDT